MVDEPSTELERVSDRTLFGTSDPAEAMAAAKRVAAVLKRELEAGDMVVKIRGREHVRLEGWQTLASMLGITGAIAWTKPLEGGGWEARGEARTLDGRLIGAAESMCTPGERHWKDRDEFALRSMAQTRALSKALGGPLRFMVTLTGHEGTPAEEMVDEPNPLEESAPATVIPRWAQPAEALPTSNALIAILELAGVDQAHESMRAIGQRVLARCDDTIPTCVLEVLRDVGSTIAAAKGG